jgi:hypothetical protein
MKIYKVRVRRKGDVDTFLVLCKRDILSLFVQGYYREIQFITELPDHIADLLAEESEED